MVVVDAAAWVFDQIRCHQGLHWDEAASEVRQLFGHECVREDAAGNLVLAPAVLQALRLLSGDSVVWDDSERMWRSQESG
jgi:hypothetical protein